VTDAANPKAICAYGDITTLHLATLGSWHHVPCARGVRSGGLGDDLGSLTGGNLDVD
jgi:muramoyltetrapeptide carboxypeptidase LdcA involved in peptidoglycan recycling